MTAAEKQLREIDRFIEGTRCLTAIPENSIRILNLLSDPNFNMRALLRRLEQEPAIAARIITVVNSAAYARSNRITSLERATVYLGVNTIKEIVSATMLKGLCRPGLIGKYSSIALWEHSVAVAVASRELALRCKGLEPETAFLAGMLHDVGLLLYVQSEAETAASIFSDADTEDQVPFVEIEKGYLGFNHCELGSRMATLWKFPAELIAASGYHHAPSEAPGNQIQLCNHIAIADTLCGSPELGFPITCKTQKITSDMLDQAKFSKNDVDEVKAHLKVALRLHLS